MPQLCSFRHLQGSQVIELSQHCWQIQECHTDNSVVCKWHDIQISDNLLRHRVLTQNMRGAQNRPNNLCVATKVFQKIRTGHPVYVLLSFPFQEGWHYLILELNLLKSTLPCRVLRVPYLAKSWIVSLACTCKWNVVGSISRLWLPSLSRPECWNSIPSSSMRPNTLNSPPWRFWWNQHL